MATLTDHRPYVMRSVLLAVVRLGGAITVIVSTLAWPPLVALVIGWVFELNGEDDDKLFRFVPEQYRPYLLPVTLACAAVAIGGRLVGQWLVRFGRHQVLFLRRFRDASTAAFITRVVATVGGYWRLVALDDQTLRPVGGDPAAVAAVGRADRVVTGGENLFSRILLLYTGLIAAMLVIGVAATATSLAVIAVTGDEGFWTIILRYGVYAVILAIAGMAAGPIALLILLMVFPISFAFRGLVLAARKSEESVSFTIDDADQMHSVLRQIRTMTRRVFSGRLIVVAVADALWRQTVLAFIQESDAVLVDVSVPSEHVVWEVEQLATMRRPAVFVGDQERVDYLIHGELADPHARRLRDLLRNQAILTYRHESGPDAIGRFSRALRDRLESTRRDGRSARGEADQAVDSGGAGRDGGASRDARASAS